MNSYKTSHSYLRKERVIKVLIHTGTQTIITKRLVLRRLTENDVQAMYENWCTDENTTKYLSWEPYTEVEKLREFVLSCLEKYESPEYYHWLIEFEGSAVGAISLHSISNKCDRAELGYSIGSRWWNRGIVTEAAGAVTEYAFKSLGANRICALHDMENAASGRVMEKIGMKREGVLRQHSKRRDGSFGDMAFYGILKSEWDEKEREQ